jgi:CBS domain containing-hemolysin-like protein
VIQDFAYKIFAMEINKMDQNVLKVMIVKAKFVFKIDDMFNFERFDAVWVEFVIKVIAVTFLLVLFGEVMPKVLATNNNIRFARDFGGIIQAVSYACAGLSKRLVNFSDVIEKRLANKTNGSFSLEELDHAIDLTAPANEQESEKKILNGNHLQLL